MKKNLTLKLDEHMLKKGKHVAVEENMSLSEWVAQLITAAVLKRESLAASKKSALKFMAQGFDLGGKPLSRDSLHER